MVDTVYKIGDKVYGVHTEVVDKKCYVYVVKEKIDMFYEGGGWRSKGTINGTPVYSQVVHCDVFNTREEAVKYADSLAMTSDETMRQEGFNGWNQVVKVYAKK